MKNHTKKIVNELCHYLGHDLDSPACLELHRHLEKCPECQAYIQSIKQTVQLCKNLYASQQLPTEVKLRILKSLGIQLEKK